MVLLHFRCWTSSPKFTLNSLPNDATEFFIMDYCATLIPNHNWAGMLHTGSLSEAAIMRGPSIAAK